MPQKPPRGTARGPPQLVLPPPPPYPPPDTDVTEPVTFPGEGAGSETSELRPKRTCLLFPFHLCVDPSVFLVTTDMNLFPDIPFLLLDICTFPFQISFQMLNAMHLASQRRHCEYHTVACKKEVVVSTSVRL